ncbi:hypothetical protein BAU15_02325 [Enterococcus sp. JM4C]|uniref:YesL family protein n=1 Tax=Candidatus Enterococcus huntleyi TaxID=1857217 RepID=UPI001379F109|nr:DUF624 domain-containing protein [Enterococcus sp. JM4C]KAF1299499.1 hypothetical protein BAU15_02325 [Enterococcus sp. JM4C]
MKFNMDSSFHQNVTLFIQFVLLNVIFILTCLPIVTIGAATTALLAVTTKYAEHQDAYLIKDYFSYFKENWRRATAVYFSLGMPILFLFFSSIFWFAFKTILTSIVGLAALFIAGYFLLALLISFSLVGRFDNGLKQTLKNALLLPFDNPVKVIGVLLLPLTIFCLLVLMPGMKILLFVFGFSFAAYCCSFLFLSIYKQY